MEAVLRRNRWTSIISANYFIGKLIISTYYSLRESLFFSFAEKKYHFVDFFQSVFFEDLAVRFYPHNVRLIDLRARIRR